jgi:glutamate-1-semialdehyde 2,1-aminomutase
VTMPLFLFDDDKDMRMGFRWCSAMLERGIYTHPWHNMFLCAAMTTADIDQTLAAAEGAFKVLKAEAPKLEPVPKLAFLTA